MGTSCGVHRKAFPTERTPLGRGQDPQYKHCEDPKCKSQTYPDGHRSVSSTGHWDHQGDCNHCPN